MGSSALVALGLLLAVQFLIQNEGVESKKHWPSRVSRGGSKVMQRGWGGGLMQKVLYRQDKLRHWLQELQGVTHYQEETNHRVDEELNTFQSELRKRKQQTDGKLNTIQSELRKLQRIVKKVQSKGGCGFNEVRTIDLAGGNFGCCEPGFSLARGVCCKPNFLVKDIINSAPDVGNGLSVSTNCCPAIPLARQQEPQMSVDGICCAFPMKVSFGFGPITPDQDPPPKIAARCCALGDSDDLDDDFECVPDQG